jgi:D-alanine--poly(phosphoribitol) ligase subunit 1
MSASGSNNLAQPLYRNGIAAPDRLALAVAGRELSYAELANRSRAVADWLLAAGVGGSKGGRAGVLAGRSAAAYAGVLGACWAGATYVPLGLNWPEERLLAVLQLTRLDALIVDMEGVRRLSPLVLTACPRAILIAQPDAAVPAGSPFDGLRFPFPAAPAAAEPVALPDHHVAYIIFTSGTTGTPKGVEIGLGAIVRHLAVIQEIYKFTPEDRVSLAFDLTFDPSILNMFMTWNAGASLHVVPTAELYGPADFIQRQRLSVWNSAPTTIGLLLTLGALDPGMFPLLRVSIFGGDTLTLAAAQAWQGAAPASTVDNVYGPAEATIECLHQRLTDPPMATRERGSLAIGMPYAGTEAAILDENLTFLPACEIGELAVSGDQLALGYLDRPDLTAARFPTIDGQRWYLTGDSAYRDAGGRFHHLGRRDDQVKVRGHRVELGDVDSHLRQVCGTELAAAVAWPFADGSPVGIVGFVAGSPGGGSSGRALSPRAVLAALRRRLPDYMVPRQIRRIASLPMTPHGKVDRRALVRLLEAEERSGSSTGLVGSAGYRRPPPTDGTAAPAAADADRIQEATAAPSPKK